MKTRALFPLCLTLLASVAVASPIPVSGSGTFFADPVSADSSFTVSFSGTDGMDSIALNASCGGGGWASTSISGPVGHCDGSTMIDGLFFGGPGGINGTFSFDLASNGSGFAAGNNSALSQHAFVSLIGYVRITSESCFGSGGNQGCSGNFAVDTTPVAGSVTPEPGSLALGLLGLAAIALRIANSASVPVHRRDRSKAL